MKDLFKKIYGCIALLYLLPIAFFIATELQWIDSHFISEPTYLYVGDMIAISSLLCGAYFSFTLFSLKRPLSTFAAASTEEQRKKAYCRWVGIRECILWTSISLCLLVYSLTSSTDTATFSLIILLLVRVYIFPTQKEYLRIYPS